MLGFICRCCVISVSATLSHSLPGGSCCPATSVPRPDMAALSTARVERRLPLAVGLQAEVLASPAARSQVGGLLPSASSQAVRIRWGSTRDTSLRATPPASTQPGFPCGPEPPGPVSSLAGTHQCLLLPLPRGCQTRSLQTLCSWPCGLRAKPPRAAIRLSRI